ncbi:lysylphosphatidylglycerol synthase domain-containing protein [Actinomadura welshii]|uniref:Uncharacterized membrane protein YbhN (UPF0104 family) n=1 Tax=Actinomadura livida TaxID=79909 RepID=A0A7W7ICI3_9ACTN|nr:lysylphosphatidylglycerol synthase domain-containing protein [Actinomadura catellatispora]MBB4774481.1 uncharacterized membrane protein YbhN (UPF0104 family) [Actinomadura catellatispora]
METIAAGADSAASAGLPGTGGEAAPLPPVRRIRRPAAAALLIAAGSVPPVPLAIAAGVLLAAAVPCGRRAARSAAAVRAVEGLTDLCRRPRALLVVLAGSAATTFTLGLAFALSVLAVPGTAAAPSDLLVLVAAYLVAAAAGSAVPAPGGIGSTEAALVAALVALGITAGPALHAVLLFRAVTFWAPVPLGLLAFRTLRR